MKPCRTRDDEAGFVFVWFAIVILLLLGVAAIVVDILMGYSAAQRAQNAADAGALAGAQFLPDDRAAAEARAVDVVNDNINASQITFETVAYENQLAVRVKADVGPFFGKIFGDETLSVTKRAIAAYDPPIALGSPFNTFGNTPGSGTAQPKFWANVVGPLSVKGGGNAALSNWCDDSSVPAHWLGNPSTADNCGDGATNVDDYEGAQYFVVDKRAGGQLRVDIFDPAYVETFAPAGANPGCAHPSLAAVQAAEGSPGHLDPVNVEFCAGDQYIRFRGSEAYDSVPAHQRELQMEAAGIANDTTFTLYPPDATPSNSFDNETTAAPVCPPRTYEGHHNAELARLAAADGTFATLHAWEEICTDPVPTVTGKYVLKVTVAAGTHGNNNFAIRAYAGGAPFGDADVSVYAVERMAVLTNESSSTGEFFLARVPPSSLERTLSVTLFDVGDNFGGTGAATIEVFGVQGPATAPTGVTQFAGCRYGPPPGSSGPGLLSPWKQGAPAWGSPTATNGASPCEITGITRAAYNGQYVTIDIPIPPAPTYTCDASVSTECWLKIRFTTPGNVTDVSTWVATLGGEPVRIVQ